jgi:hypothetical protein
MDIGWRGSSYGRIVNIINIDASFRLSGLGTTAAGWQGTITLQLSPSALVAGPYFSSPLSFRTSGCIWRWRA